MPRVNIPDRPSSGPGSSSNFKSLHVRSKKRVLESSSSSSSSSSDGSIDELSYTSSSTDFGTSKKRSIASKNKSSSLLITPKLMTQEVSNRQVKSSSSSSSSLSVLQKNIAFSNTNKQQQQQKQPKEESNRRKVSFSTLVQDMMPSSIYDLTVSDGKTTTPARNECKKSAMKHSFSTQLPSSSNIPSTSSLIPLRSTDVYDDDNDEEEEDDDDDVAVITPPSWISASKSSSSSSSSSTSIEKSTISGITSTMVSSKSNHKDTSKLTSIDNSNIQQVHRNPSQDSSLDVWRVQQIHCIAVDTRCLSTSLGNVASQSFTHHVQKFLQSCCHRGILPRSISTPKAVVIGEQQQQNEEEEEEGQDQRLGGYGRIRISTQPLISWSSSSSTHHTYKAQQKHKQVIQANTFTDDCESTFYAMLPRYVIRPPRNVDTFEHGKETIYVPKLLFAHESWTLFSSFVQSIVDEEKKRETMHETKISQPLDITIFTNDMALFSDADEENHRRGMDRFRDDVNTFFDKGIIRSVSLIIVDTDTFALWDHPESKMGDKCKSTDVESTQLEKQKEENGSGDTDVTDKENVEGNVYLSKLFNPHRLKVQKCLRSMQDRLMLSKDLEFKYNAKGSRSHLVQVQLTVMDCNATSFQSLLVDWASHAVKSIGTNAGMARVRFDLPSTKDGTECSVTLDLSYAVFPHKLDTPNRLWKDMSMLHDSYFQIIQMIPLVDVDASLIYGVPFVAKASSEGELWQHKEMKVLVQQLFRYLITHQVALVLMCDEGNHKQRIVSGVGVGGSEEFLYHAMNTQHIFLLIAEETNDTVPFVPNGVLYRYANRPDQMLHHGSGNPNDSMVDAAHDTEDMYYDYVVESLGCVETCSMNPFDRKHETYGHRLRNDHRASKDSSPLF